MKSTTVILATKQADSPRISLGRYEAKALTSVLRSDHLKLKWQSCTALVTIVLFLYAPAGFCASLIFNGGLELSPSDSGIQTVLPGQSYAGWSSVGSGDVEFCPPSVMGPAIQGQGLVDLNGIAFQGAISQTLGTTSGTIYNIRFALSGNPGLPFLPRIGDKTVDVFWNGNLAGSFVFHHLVTDTQQNLRWEYHELTLLGNGNDVLRFSSTTSAYNDAGPVIDDITVAVVPEPSVLAVLAVGGLALIRRSGRSKVQRKVETQL